MDDDYDDEDLFAADALLADDEPIPGLGELPDCDDDVDACQVVGPADGGQQ